MWVEVSTKGVCVNTEELRIFAREKVIATIEARAAAVGSTRSLWAERPGSGIMGALIDEELGGKAERAVSSPAGVSVSGRRGLRLGFAFDLVDHVILCAYPCKRFGSAACEGTSTSIPLRWRTHRGGRHIRAGESGGDPNRWSARRENGDYLLSGSKEPSPTVR